MKYTKKAAKETVEAYKDMTCYFDGSMTQKKYVSNVEIPYGLWWSWNTGYYWGIGYDWGQI